LSALLVLPELHDHRNAGSAIDSTADFVSGHAGQLQAGKESCLTSVSL
jgi:hypothetical protein